MVEAISSSLLETRAANHGHSSVRSQISQQLSPERISKVMLMISRGSVQNLSPALFCHFQELGFDWGKVSASVKNIFEVLLVVKHLLLQDRHFVAGNMVLQKFESRLIHCHTLPDRIRQCRLSGELRPLTPEAGRCSLPPTGASMSPLTETRGSARTRELVPHQSSVITAVFLI